MLVGGRARTECPKGGASLWALLEGYGDTLNGMVLSASKIELALLTASVWMTRKRRNPSGRDIM